MIRLEHYPVAKLKKEIIAAVGKHLDLNQHRIFFFGSRVAGGGHEGSDIDVGIEGPKPLATTTLAAIEEEIEKLPVLYKIEIVDFKTVTEKFREVALQHIEPLH